MGQIPSRQGGAPGVVKDQLMHRPKSRRGRFYEMMLTGLSYKEIAHTLGLSMDTAKVYGTQVCRRRGVANRISLMAMEIKRLREELALR